MTDAAAPSGPSGVGGWLAFFVFACFLSPVVMVGKTLIAWSDVTGQAWIRLVSVAPAFAFARGYEIAGEITLAASLLSLAFLILRKHPAAARVAVIVLTIMPIFYLSDYLVTAVSLGQLHYSLHQMGRPVPASSGTEGVQTVRASMASLVWLLYFFKSKRVSNTFGPVTWSGTAGLLKRRARSS